MSASGLMSEGEASAADTASAVRSGSAAGGLAVLNSDSQLEDTVGFPEHSTNIDRSASMQAQETPPAADAPPEPEVSRPSTPESSLVKSTGLASGKVPWTPLTLVCWFALGIIRGTTALMLALAGDDIRPTVIVILRSPGTVLLFLFVMILWSCNSPAMKANLKASLSQPMTYVKLTVLGIIQSGGPFLLFTFGLTHVPSSFGGAFMAMVPVWTVIVDQSIFRALGFKIGKVNGLKILGMVVIVGGVAIFVVPHVVADLGPAIQNECLKNATNSSLSLSDRKRLCASGGQVGLNILELILGSFLFGLAAVFWRNAKGNIHFTLAGSGQTVVGGIVAVIFWGGLNDGEFSPNFTPGSISALVYLIVFSGFGAASLLFFLYGKIGAVPTARVMCLVPVVAWVEDRIFYPARGTSGLGLEAAGLVVLIFGLLLFEGRVDQVCGFNVPCYKAYERYRARQRFSASLKGDAEVKARGLSTRLLEDSFEGVDVLDAGTDEVDLAHENMAKYSSSVGDFEVVF